MKKKSNINDLGRMELEWKQVMKEILQNVGREYPINYHMQTYDELVRAHKKIFGENHDSYWVGMGFGSSRDQLNTYLLIKNHNMLAQLLQGRNNNNIVREEEFDNEVDKEKWIPKEDFKEIDKSELPNEFLENINEEYLENCFLKCENTLFL